MHKIIPPLRRDHRMLRVVRRFVRLTMALAALVLCPPPVLAVGLDPVPVFAGADVQVDVQRDATSSPFFDQFVYTYTISNPATNTGEIWYIKIDISEPFKRFDLPADPTLQLGATTMLFNNYRQLLEPLALPAGASVIPIGQKVPPGWLGGFGRDGFLGFASGDAAINIQPGQSLGGFRMESRRVPTIREIRVIPNWVHLVVNHDDVTEEERDQAADVELDLLFTTFTLGPSPVIQQGSFAHWNRLRDDLKRMIDELQWIDPTLGATLVAQLTAARAALDAADGTLAKARLQTFLATLAQAPAAQLRTEALQPAQLNADSLIANTPDTPIPFEPEFTITPKVAALPVGARYTLTVQVVNAADNDRPVPDFDLTFQISGPHEENFARSRTDANGQATLAFTGTQLGTDRIQIITDGWEELILDEARVTWTGGPDLVVPFFMPPIIAKEDGDEGLRLFVTDVTANLGTIAAPPTVTRYFFSATEPVDPAIATVLGERPVPSLEPEEFNDGVNLELTLPSGLPPGTYFLAACADANATVVELDEDNNCSFNKLDRVVSIVVRGEVANQAPTTDCALLAVEDHGDDDTEFLIQATGTDAEDGALMSTVRLFAIAEDGSETLAAELNNGDRIRLRVDRDRVKVERAAGSDLVDNEFQVRSEASKFKVVCSVTDSGGLTAEDAVIVDLSVTAPIHEAKPDVSEVPIVVN